MTADILGRDEVIDLGSIGGATFGLAARKALDRRLDLGQMDRITQMSYRWRDEPLNRVPELIKGTYNTMKAFNEAQGAGLRMNAIMDVDWLTAAILASLNRRQSDAQAFLDADLLPDPGHPLGTEIFILGVAPTGNTRYRDTWSCRMAWAARNVDGPNAVTLRMLEGVSVDDLNWELLDREYGIKLAIDESDPTLKAQICGLDDGIARLLCQDSVALDFGN